MNPIDLLLVLPAGRIFHLSHEIAQLRQLQISYYKIWYREQLGHGLIYLTVYKPIRIVLIPKNVFIT